MDRRSFIGGMAGALAVAGCRSPHGEGSDRPAAPNMVGVFAGHDHQLQVGAENGVPQFVVPMNFKNGMSLNVELRNA